MPLEVRRETKGPFSVATDFQEESGIVSLGSTELLIPLELSKGCEASCQDEAGN